MNRRWVAALAVTTILGSGALVAATTAPSSAGPPYKYDVYHSLRPSLWKLVSYDCAGASDEGTDLKLGTFAIRTRGAGSLRVTSDASYGGALLRSGRKGLSSLNYPVYATGSDHPTGIWRVEVGGHVLVSDPVNLKADGWSEALIVEINLHEGDWTGTTDDFQAQFGTAESYTAGFLTGGCLGSPTAYVDTVTRQRSHKIVRDLEPSTWASIHWSTAGDGGPIRLRTRLLRESITGQVKTGIPDAHMQLWRRYLHQGWQRVLTRTTDHDGVARARVKTGRTARFQWRWAGHQIVSEPLLVTTPRRPSPAEPS